MSNWPVRHDQFLLSLFLLAIGSKSAKPRVNAEISIDQMFFPLQFFFIPDQIYFWVDYFDTQ